MMRMFPLVWRYLCFHKGKSAVLALCLATAVYSPLTMHWLVSLLQEEMLGRAETTPLVVGPRGSRFDLVLHALYFQTEVSGTIPQKEKFSLSETGHGRVLPLFIRHRARGHPVVGTGLDYFSFRGLQTASGELPLRLGDCVVGWEVGRALGLQPGDRLLTDPANVFELAGEYPLDLRVTGILRQTHTPDDRAVFVDLPTAWLIEGIGHGHDDVADPGAADTVLAREGTHVRAAAAVPTHARVTAENIDTFHFHGDPLDFPLTALIVVPHDARARALILDRYLDPNGSFQGLSSTRVIEELLGHVIRLKRFFDLHHLFLVGITVLFIGLVTLLSLRLRANELRTMYYLGCARGTVFSLVLGEWMILAVVSAAMAAGAGRLTVLLAQTWIQSLTGG